MGGLAPSRPGSMRLSGPYPELRTGMRVGSASQPPEGPDIRSGTKPYCATCTSITIMARYTAKGHLAVLLLSAEDLNLIVEQSSANRQRSTDTPDAACSHLGYITLTAGLPLCASQ